MAEEQAKQLPASFPEISLSSYSTGLFGTKRLIALIKAAEVTNKDEKIVPDERNFKIPLDEWEHSFAPIFDRMIVYGTGNATEKQDRLDFAAAYNKLEHNISYEDGVPDYDEKESYHQLGSWFNAAANPDKVYPAKGKHGEMRQKFLDALHNEKMVIVTERQLQGLMNVAKGGADFVYKGTDRRPHDEITENMTQFYEKNILRNPRFLYN